MRKSALVLFLFLAVGITFGEEKKPSPKPTTRPTTAPASRPARIDPRVQVAWANLSSLEVALDVFEIDNGRYPTVAEGLRALVEKPADLKTWRGPYIKGLGNDPWGHPYVYKFPGKHNETGFDLSSYGPDGRESNDDINNWRER